MTQRPASGRNSDGNRAIHSQLWTTRHVCILRLRTSSNTALPSTKLRQDQLLHSFTRFHSLYASSYKSLKICPWGYCCILAELWPHILTTCNLQTPRASKAKIEESNNIGSDSVAILDVHSSRCSGAWIDVEDFEHVIPPFPLGMLDSLRAGQCVYQWVHTYICGKLDQVLHFERSPILRNSSSKQININKSQ